MVMVMVHGDFCVVAVFPPIISPYHRLIFAQYLFILPAFSGANLLCVRQQNRAIPRRRFHFHHPPPLHHDHVHGVRLRPKRFFFVDECML
jgi:hypothetical protein